MDDYLSMATYWSVLIKVRTFTAQFIVSLLLVTDAQAGDRSSVLLTDEMLSNAWSAMDQAYPREPDCEASSTLPVGTPLRSPDNSAVDSTHARKMPWDIPNSFRVTFDSGIVQGGGRVVIYEDDSGTIMSSFMGTNGFSDSEGWSANMRDMSLRQFYVSPADAKSIANLALKHVFTQTEAVRRRGKLPRVLFVGDSKGGAQAQMAMAIYVRAREYFPNVLPEWRHAYEAGRFVSNKELGLVAHSSPGAAAGAKQIANVDPVKYAGIEMHYSYSRNLLYPEVVAAIGDSYVGVGEFNPSASVYSYRTSYFNLLNMHRLVASGYKFFKDGHSFGDMVKSKKPISIDNSQSLADVIFAVKDTFIEPPVKFVGNRQCAP